ncbi:hypothetical protein ACFV3R_31550 [Streptomyces sp. NPDC059740]|uniref:hypothetical protein n=1 Tax=Streptomyces sp. NPDC059740 TaxID=3346926 RepID=UPI00364C2D8D
MQRLDGWAARHDGHELSDLSPGSPHWYTGGVNWAGAVALVAATAVSACCLATGFWTGPWPARPAARTSPCRWASSSHPRCTCCWGA